MLTLITIQENFSVCKLKDFSKVKWDSKYVFTGKTPSEYSLLCPSNEVPNDFLECDHDWKGFYIDGILDFSLIGILAKITTLLANNSIPVFAVSTYNTDFVFMKSIHFEKALEILRNNQYQVVSL